MRIVSLLPSATEILFAIGAGDRVVGVTHECDEPAEARTLPVLTASTLPSGLAPADVDRHVRSRLHAGSSLYALDEERLAALAPDLIVTQELCEVCAVSYDIVARAAKRLRSDPRVVSLEPSSLEDVFGTIAFLGDLAGARAGADALLASLRARVAALRARPRPSPAPRVLLLEWTEPPMSGGHWAPELVELAGGAPVLGDPGGKSRVLTAEELHAADADVVIVAPCGYDLARSVEAAAAVPPLRAFAAGRAYAIDGNAYLNRPGPRLVDTAELFAAAIDGAPAPVDGALVRLAASPRNAAPTR